MKVKVNMTRTWTGMRHLMNQNPGRGGNTSWQVEGSEKGIRMLRCIFLDVGMVERTSIYTQKKK